MQLSVLGLIVVRCVAVPRAMPCGAPPCAAPQHNASGVNSLQAYSNCLIISAMPPQRLAKHPV